MVILSLSLILNAFAWQGKPYDILQHGPLFSSFSVGFFSALPPHSQHQKQYSTRGEAVSRILQLVPVVATVTGAAQYLRM